MSRVSVRRTTGSWYVFLDGQFIAGFGTRQEARDSAAILRRVTADPISPAAHPAPSTPAPETER